jgi:hypothetical protein
MTAPFHSEDWVTPDDKGGVYIGQAHVRADELASFVALIHRVAGRGLRPIPMRKADLLEVLDGMRAAVEADDSFEGNLEYLMPDEPADGIDFSVTAVYRVGNAMGQGGVHMVGEVRR